MHFVPIVFIISAPSGSGKSTLVGRLMSEVEGLTFSVSYTTRAPRGKEKNGESYFFTTREMFEELIATDELLEFAMVFGNYYGTRRSALDEAAKKECDLVLDIDVQGAGQLKRKIPGAVSIFVLPPSRETLEARLRSRSEDPDDVIDRRLTDAAREIGNYESYDYVLINDNLEQSSKTLAGIVRAERARRARVEEKIQPILETFRDVSVPEAVTKE
jgi:guanylate kinase